MSVWLSFYLLHDDYIGWHRTAGTGVQVGMMLLCGLELVAITFVARITWR